MVSAEEKKQFIESLIALQENGGSIEDMQQSLHDLLLRDTIDGKLYKYRSFDKKGYSLKSLQTQTLFCAKPKYFNDPFDCKIGIKLFPLFEAYFQKEYTLLQTVFEDFSRILAGELCIDDCDAVEQRIMRTIFSNDIIQGYVEYKRNTPSPEDDQTEHISSTQFTKALLKTVLSDEAFCNLKNVMPYSVEDAFDGLSAEDIQRISQDDATYEDFARVRGVTDDVDEISLTLKTGEAIAPEHSSATAKADHIFDELEQTLNGTIGNDFLVGCLCTDFKNRLMWSHYANSHQGFCVEYDYSAQNASVFSKLPLPIYYSKDRPLIPWDAVVDTQAETRSAALAQMSLGILTKDSAWEYENEWRILLKSDKPANFSMPPITCIYLGASIAPRNRKRILKIAKRLRIPVKQMKVDRGAYELHAEEIYLP